MTKWAQKFDKMTDRQNWQRWPETLAHRIEAYSPELAKRVLNYASRALLPQLLTTPFRLEEWSDTRAGLQVQAADCTAGGLLTLSEFMIRTLLGRHLALPEAGLRIRRASFELDSAIHEQLKMRLELNAHERESWLQDLFRYGVAERQMVVHLWSTQEQRLGEISFLIELQHTPALPQPAESDNT